MLKYLKIGVSTLALSAFVLAPAVTVITSDAAYAKNENGNNGKGGGNGGGNKGGNGNGNGGGNKGGGDGKSNGKGFSGDKSAKGKSDKARGPNSTRATIQGDLQKLGKNIKSGFGLFGKNKQTAKAAKPKTSNASKQVAARTKGPMHPSNLGKLNGAINSSPNAKAAHIANGNFNGPVGLAAALALEDFNFDLATDAFVSAEETLAIATSLEEANAILSTEAPSEEAVADAQDFLDNVPTDATEADIAAAEAVLGDAAARAEAQSLVDSVEAPSEEAVADAQATVDAGPPNEEGVVAAEQAILAEYKGTLAEENQDQVLDAVRDANPDADAIEAAIAKGADPISDENDDVEDTDQAMADDAIAADQG